MGSLREKEMEKFQTMDLGPFAYLGNIIFNNLKVQDLYQCKLVNKSWNQFIKVKYEDKFYNYMYELKRSWIEGTFCEDEETKFLKRISIDSDDLLSEGEYLFQRGDVYITENKSKNKLCIYGRKCMKKVKIIDLKNCSLSHYFQSQRWLFVIVIETSFYFTKPEQVPEKINVVSVYDKSSNFKHTRYKREHFFGSNENYSKIEVMGDTIENCKLFICFLSTFRIVSIGWKGIVSSKDYSLETYFEKSDYIDLHVGNDGKLVIIQNKDPGKYYCHITDIIDGVPKYLKSITINIPTGGLWRYYSHENKDFVFIDAVERVLKVLLYRNILLIFTYNHSNLKHEVNINVFMLHVSYDSDITNCSQIERLTNIQETFHIKDVNFNSLGIM